MLRCPFSVTHRATRQSTSGGRNRARSLAITALTEGTMIATRAPPPILLAGLPDGISAGVPGN